MPGAPHKHDSIALANPVIMRAEGVGTYVMQQVERATTKLEFIVAKGIVEVPPSRLNKIMVANMTNSQVSVHKHTKLAKLIERPTAMVNMIDDLLPDIPTILSMQSRYTIERWTKTNISNYIRRVRQPIVPERTAIGVNS